MKIYIDVLFLVNMFMDTIILWLTSVFDRRKVICRRLIAGGAAGALIYCVFIAFVFGSIVGSIILYLASLSISILIVFRPTKIKTFIRLIIFSVFSSVILGGTLTAIFNFIDVQEIISNAVGAFSFKLMIALTIIFYCIMKYAGGIFISSSTKRQDFCRIKVYLNNKWSEITVLMDTGNFLIEDSLGRKIIIAEFLSIKDILSNETQLLYLKKLSSEKIMEEIKNEEEIKRIFLLPFSSLGAGNENLTAYKIDFAEIYTEEKTVIKNAVIAVYNGKLSGNSSFCGIINPIILEG